MTAPPARRGPARPTEALWVLDDTGTLSAYTGWTSRPAARMAAGVPAGPVVPVLVSGGGLLWVYALRGQLAIINPATLARVARLTVPPASPPGLGAEYYAFGALWVAQPGRLWRVTGTGKVTETVLPGGFAVGDGTAPAVAATARWLWLGSYGRLLRIDPATGAVSGTVRLPGIPIDTLTAAPQGLVATVVNRPDVLILDPSSGQRRWSARLPDGSMIVTPYTAGRNLWAVGANGTAIRIGDQRTPITAKVVFSSNSEDFPADTAAGSLWIADEDMCQVVRIDAATGRTLARFTVTAADPDDPAFYPLAGQSALWVVDSNLADGFSRVDLSTSRSLRVLDSTGVHDSSAAVAPPPAAARPGQRPGA